MLYSILILGSAQGLFLALLLVSKRIGSTANNVLALAMVAFSIYIVSEVYYGQSLYVEYPLFIGMTESIVFLFGPLLYLYTRIVSLGEHAFKKIYWLHFLPFVVYTLVMFPVFLQDIPDKIELVEQVLAGQAPLYMKVANKLKFVHGITYVILTFFVIRRHEGRIREQFSYTEKIDLHWLRNLLIGNMIVWTLATVLEVLFISGVLVSEPSWVVTIATTILIYAIGYMGLRQSDIFAGSNAFRPEEESVGGQKVSKSVEDRAVNSTESTQYKRSGLSDAEAEVYQQKLLDFMDRDRPFTHSELTLRNLSDELSISAHNLSEIINTRLGNNFYDFVNGYRIREVQRKLKDTAFDHLTILSLAYDAGFNSKSAFNASFKKITGVTPSQYRKKERSAPVHKS